MRTRQLYFLLVLAEEGGETAQAAAKAGRFTMNDKKKQNLIEEVSDVIAASRCLGLKPDEARIKAKMKKLKMQAGFFVANGSGDPDYKSK